MTTKNLNVLLIDDDINLCRVLSYQLQKNNYEVQIAHEGNEGLRLFRQGNLDVVLLDIQMPDVSGIQVLREIRREDKNAVVIMITAYGSVDSALDACRIGADDYITKPFGQEQMLFVIEKAVRLRRLQQENIELHHELEDKHQFGNIVAKSAPMEEVLRTASKVANSDATVLILGESGTGKEVLARAIHYNSPRKDKPLITVNCPSVPDNLLESELFGHVKGAFTGAVKDRKGKFEMAEGGTIFLDEIADLKESLQAKLLRVLQEHEIEPVGSSRKIKTDARVIAATNKDLEKRVEEGLFREDLYYRLNVVPITIPPLRERKEEIPYLVDYFVEKYGKGQKYDISPDFTEAMKNYHWPGNIRELENVIERAIVLTSDNQLTGESLPAHLLQKQKTKEQNKDQKHLLDDDMTLEDIERLAIQKALKKSDGNKTQAAKFLDIPRHVLLYRMKKFGLD